MNCVELERILPDLVDAQDGGIPSDVEAHVESCPACSDLLSDLKLISSEARQLAESDEPAPRVWVNIAAQLRAEGVIRDQETVPAVVATPGRRWWSAWWLAPIAAALLAAGSYVVSHKPAPTVAQQPAAPAVKAQAPVQSSPTQQTPVQSAAEANPSPVPVPAPVQMARRAPRSAGVVNPSVESAPSAEDQQFLSAVSTLAPSARESYERELQAVNADIQETQAYVKRFPGDADARQHLMDAYEQKALLYQIALDRIQ